ERVSVLLMDREGRSGRAHGTGFDDYGEPFQFGAVCGAICAVSPGHRDEMLAIEAQPVVRGIGDAAGIPIHGLGRWATVDLGARTQGPAHAHLAVTTTAGVIEVDGWLHPIDAGGHGDGDGIRSGAAADAAGAFQATR